MIIIKTIAHSDMESKIDVSYNTEKYTIFEILEKNHMSLFMEVGPVRRVYELEIGTDDK